MPPTVSRPHPARLLSFNPDASSFLLRAESTQTFITALVLNLIVGQSTSSLVGGSERDGVALQGRASDEGLTRACPFFP
jgi:hypothetical protein